MNSDELDKAISKEVNHGWELNLKVTLLQSFNNSGVVPLEVVEQFSIKKKGDFYIKWRITCDCSSRVLQAYP